MTNNYSQKHEQATSRGLIKSLHEMGENVAGQVMNYKKKYCIR